MAGALQGVALVRLVACRHAPRACDCLSLTTLTTPPPPRTPPALPLAPTWSWDAAILRNSYCYMPFFPLGARCRAPPFPWLPQGYLVG